ncbi:MAG: serine/threonine protein kinase [Bacilli bacterium]|nr:serine/threonine protein kinase [Bacilli bacterium]
MTYYLSNNQPIEFDFSNAYQINHGSFGNVYKINEKECVKIFKNSVLIDRTILRDIMSLHLFYFDTIIELLFNEYNRLSGYLMNRHFDVLPDFFSMTSKEFLRIFRRLVSNIKILTENNILVCDLAFKNTVGTINDFKIIDYDFYSRSKSKDLLQTNMRLLINLWNEIFKVQRLLNGYRKIVSERNIDSIFIPYSSDTDRIINEIAKSNFVFDAIVKR